MRLRSLAASAALVVGIVVSTFSATPAANAGTVWDGVAACESGGNWAINTGNGYYGGLQIAAGTWGAFGGGAYASLPHRATKREQIIVATRIVRGQGWSAWGSCAGRLGLRGNTPPPLKPLVKLRAGLEWSTGSDHVEVLLTAQKAGVR